MLKSTLLLTTSAALMFGVLYASNAAMSAYGDHETSAACTTLTAVQKNNSSLESNTHAVATPPAISEECTDEKTSKHPLLTLALDKMLSADVRIDATEQLLKLKDEPAAIAAAIRGLRRILIAPNVNFTKRWNTTKHTYTNDNNAVKTGVIKLLESIAGDLSFNIQQRLDTIQMLFKLNNGTAKNIATKELRSIANTPECEPYRPRINELLNRYASPSKAAAASSEKRTLNGA